MVWLTHHIKTARNANDPADVLATLTLGLMTLAVVCAWASYTMHEAGIASYKVPERYSTGTFADLYLLYTVGDMIPGLDLLHSLSIVPTIAPQDTLAGIPVLLFRAYVTWGFIEAIVAWRRRTTGAPATS